MAELTLDQFAQALDAAPLTKEQLEKQQAGRVEPVQPSRFAAPDFATKLGGRPGIPLDINSGLPWGTRYLMENFPTDEEKFRFLERKYPGKVRKNTYGHPVVEVTDETGTKDVLVDPIGVELGDISEAAAEAPEWTAAIMAAIGTSGATSGPGLAKLAMRLGLPALAAQAGGTVKDVVTRALSGEEYQPTEIAKRRTALGAADFFSGLALGAGGKVASHLITPFQSKTPLQFNAKQAHQYIKDKYGIDLQRTAGEVTGSETLIALEAQKSALPVSRGVFRKFQTQKLEQIDELRNLMTGMVPDTEEGGKRIINAASSLVAPIEWEVEKTAKAAADSAAQAIKAGIGKRVDQTALGEAIEQRAVAKRAAFKFRDKANYDALFDHPKAKEFVIDADPLADSIRGVMDEMFPKVQKTVQQSTGVLGPSGAPITVPVEVQEVLDKQIKPGLQARLEELAATRGGKVSLQSLKEIRTDIGDAIAIGQAIPGVKEGTLKRAEKALTDAINDGLDQIGDPDLRKLWDTARTFHAKERPKFEKAGIAEIFRDPSQPGHLGPTKLVERVTSGSADAQDTYRAYREFFGPNSVEVQGIQQAIRDDTLKLSELSETIDAAGFIKRLETLEQNAPDAFKDAFGAAGKDLRLQAMAVRVAKGETVDKDELVAAVNSGTLTADKLRKLLNAQDKRTTEYANKLKADIAKGLDGTERIQPHEVVDKFVFRKSTAPEDLEKLVSELYRTAPDAVEDLRRLTMKRVLDDATVPLKSGDWTLSAEKLESMLVDDNLKKRLVSTLGMDGFQDLHEVVNLLKPGEVLISSARSAGGLVGGSQTAGITEKAPWKWLPQFAKNFVLATIYTSPGVRKYVSNTAMSQEGTALVVNSLITSAPFMRAIATTFTDEAGRKMATMLKNGVDQLAAMDPASMQPGVTAGTKDIPWEDFISRLPGGSKP